MTWYKLYEMEFGSSIESWFADWEQEIIRRVRNLDPKEVFDAIRDLKAQDQEYKTFQIRLPGVSDIISAIKRKRSSGASKRSADKILSVAKEKLLKLRGRPDVEIFDAIISAMDVIGVRRDLTSLEIKVALRWASDNIGYDHVKAQEVVSKRLRELNSLLETTSNLTSKRSSKRDGM